MQPRFLAVVLGLGLTACSGSGDKYPASTHPHLGQVPFAAQPGMQQSEFWRRASDCALADFDGDGIGDAYLLGEELASTPTLHGAFVYGDRVGRHDDGHWVGRTSRPSDCVAADFDGDGRIDVAVARSGQSDGPSFVLFNRGARQYQERAGGDFGAAAVAFTALAASDIDGDGDVDLVATCGAPDSGIRLYRNDGTGRFADASAGLPRQSFGFARLVLGGLDGDLFPDLVATGSARTIVWRNAGDGTFTDIPSALPSNAGTGAADLDILHADSDGALDLVLAQNGAVRLWHNVGGLTFAAGTTVPGNGASARAADADGDGDDDLATVLDGTVRVLHGDGTGTFVEVATVIDDYGHEEITKIARFADLDGNGYADLFATASDLRLYRGTAPNRYTIDARSPYLQVPGAADRVVLGDVNGDGLDDALIGTSASGGYAYRLHTNGGHFQLHPTSTTLTLERARIADFDGDGRGDVLSDTGWHKSLGNEIEPLARPWPVPDGVPAATLDADRDGALEVVLVLPSELLLVEYRPAGLSGVSLWATPTSGVTVGDLTGDGWADILIRTAGNELRLLQNDGTGSFADASSRLPATPSEAVSFAVADLDGDGDDDVVLTDERSRVLRWWNDGNNGMRSEVTETFGGRTIWVVVVAATPFSGSGPADLVLSHTFWFSSHSATSVYRMRHANRAGGYDAGDVFSSPALGHTIQMADLDGDRDLDVIAQSFRVRTLPNHHIHLHSTGIARRGLDYELTLQRAPGYASAPQAATIAIGLPGPPTLVPAIGTWFVGTTGLQVPVVLPAGSGTAAVRFPVPATLVPGTEIEAQAMLLDGASNPARFSNPTRDLVY